MYMSKLTQQVTYPVVETAAGKLRGLCKEGGYIFRGIRYGKAERFQPPEPVQPWTGVRDALAYGCAAPELYTELAADQFQQPRYYVPQHEDCQYLNLWTQSLDRESKRPVLVWFHGGGWDSGSSVEQFAYDGENMSRYGNLVFISVEHRLNCLGGLDLSAFGERYRLSNWASLCDTLLALHWVRENAAAFGGNPDNVTLIGHAGGSSQVMTLLNTADADGLYHKAAIGGIPVSHTDISGGMTVKEAAQCVGRLTVQNLGLTAETVGRIEDIPYWYLAEAACNAREQIQKEFCGRYQFEPAADEKHLFTHTLEHPLRPETAAIPILSGSDFYAVGQPASHRVQKGILDIMRKHAAAGGKAWNWMFAPDPPTENGTAPWRCCGSAYITHNARYMEASYVPSISDQLQDLLCGAYAAFAEHGDPNHSLLPNWDSVTEECASTMIIDAHPRLFKTYGKSLFRSNIQSV